MDTNQVSWDTPIFVCVEGMSGHSTADHVIPEPEPEDTSQVCNSELVVDGLSISDVGYTIFFFSFFFSCYANKMIYAVGDISGIP